EPRPPEHGREVHRRAHPVEDRAVRQVAADEEDAEIGHVSDRVARSRASRSKCRRRKWPITRYTAPSSKHMPISGQALPAMAPPRAALTPQVGPSTHEIGPTQTGSSERETRRPVASQTGYSSRFESAFA